MMNTSEKPVNSSLRIHKTLRVAASLIVELALVEAYMKVFYLA